jgi:glycosyltransferase involved in cell wall biosynthesis
MIGESFEILLINYRDITNPRAGGAEVHLHETFKRIAGKGHRVHLLCAGYAGAGREDTIDGLHITRVGREAWFNLAAQLFLKRVPDGRYDVVIEDVNKIPVYSPLFVRAPVMLIIPHLFGTTVFQEASLPIGLYVFFWELLMPRVYRRLVIEVISDSTKEDLVRRGFREEDIHVIHCGLDTDLYYPDDTERHTPPYPYIISIGRLKKYKRLDIMLRAFRALAPDHADLKLLIVGEGDHAAALKSMARRLDLQDRVIFTGRVLETEKVRLLRGALFAVSTSPKEGWGLSNMEAQACSVPVVASDSPGLRESVRHRETGLLVPHGDVASLEDAMRLLLIDEGLRRDLARGASHWAAGFRWERTADETLSLISEICARSDQRGRT